MGNIQKRFLILLFGLMIGALIMLAAALPDMAFEPGEPFPMALLPSGFGQPILTSPSSEGGGSLRIIAILIFWIGVPLAIIYTIVSPEARRRLMQIMPAIIGLLLLLYWFSRLPKQPRSQQGEEFGIGRADFAETNLPPMPEFVADPPPWLLFGVNVLLGLLFLAVILFLWRLFRRQRGPSPQSLIIKEAERALSNLQAGEDLKNTIIRCYAEMSEVLQREKNVKRRRGMTVREFESQLAVMGLDDAHIKRLTRLFEQVRYSPSAPGGREEREAVDCLNAIIRVYGDAS